MEKMAFHDEKMLKNKLKSKIKHFISPKLNTQGIYYPLFSLLGKDLVKFESQYSKAVYRVSL